MRYLNNFLAILICALVGVAMPVAATAAASVTLRVVTAIVWVSMIGYPVYSYWSKLLNR